MRKDTGVDGDAQRISQMVWMFFMKIFADKEEEWSITINKYKSPIPDKLKWQNWASDEEGLISPIYWCLFSIDLILKCRITSECFLILESLLQKC